MSKSTPTAQSFIEHPDYAIAAAFVLGATGIASLRVLYKLCFVTGKWDCFVNVGRTESNETGGIDAVEKVEGRTNNAVIRVLERGIATTILLYSLCGFLTLISYAPGYDTACAFIVGWQTIAVHSIKVLCFFTIVQGVVGGKWELWSIYGVLFVRFGLAIVATSSNSGILLPLPSPFVSTSLCSPINTPLLAIFYTTIDIILTAYLATRLPAIVEIAKMGRTKGTLRSILQSRSCARIGSFMLFVITGCAQIRVEPNLAALWVPQSLTLLLVLPVFTLRRSRESEGGKAEETIPTFTIDFENNTSATKSSSKGLESILELSDTHTHPTSTSRDAKHAPPESTRIDILKLLPPPPPFAASSSSQSRPLSGDQARVEAGGILSDFGELFSKFGRGEQKKVTVSTIGYPRV